MRRTFWARFIIQFHHEFRRERNPDFAEEERNPDFAEEERNPDFAEEESVGLLKALRRGRRD